MKELKQKKSSSSLTKVAHEIEPACVRSAKIPLCAEALGSILSLRRQFTSCLHKSVNTDAYFSLPNYTGILN